jgi:hypothetical protein
MPFGKYKGMELSEIPRDYLVWLRDQEWVGPWLVRGIDNVLNGGPAGRAEGTHDDNGKPWAGDRNKCGAFSVVRFGGAGQDILNRDGRLIARTTDEWTAQAICNLLNENEELFRRMELETAAAHCCQ